MNLELMSAFYSELHGAEVIKSAEDSIDIRFGSSILHIVSTERSQEGKYHFAIAVGKGELKKIGKLKKERLNLMSQNENHVFRIEKWRSNSVYFYDVDFNILEFIERDYEQSNDTILSIVEIGIAVEDMKCVQEISKKGCLDIYPGILIKEKFIPLGDLEGMLLIVMKNRVWNPSSYAAGFLSTKVVYQTKNQLIYLTLNTDGKIEIDQNYMGNSKLNKSELEGTGVQYG